MGIDLYMLSASPVCRSVLLTANVLGVDVNPVITSLEKQEHLTEQYIKMNPQHTIPTIKDDGFALWESRAIMAYLCDAYGKDSSIYPSDPKQRAVVTQRLYFDNTLYQKFGDIFYPIWRDGVTEISEEKRKKLREALDLLEIFIGENDYVCGNTLTIADLSIVSSVNSFEAAGYDLTPWKGITGWLDRCKKNIKGYDSELNQEGIKAFGSLVSQKFKDAGLKL